MTLPTSTSSAASVGLLSPADGLESEPSRSPRLTPSPAASSRSTGPKSRTSGTSGKRTSANSAEYGCSRQEFLASRRALPGSAEARAMTVGSGLRLSRSLPLLLRGGSSLRTFLASLLSDREWSSSACFLCWKLCHTKSGRWLFQLALSVPRTVETASGLLPTPTARNLTRTSGDYRSLSRCLLPTPRANESSGTWKGPKRPSGAKAQLSLTQFVRLLPQARRRRKPKVGVTLVNAQLNPAFVEWMMGYPAGWTDIPRQSAARRRTVGKGSRDSATPSSPKSPCALSGR